MVICSIFLFLAFFSLFYCFYVSTINLTFFFFISFSPSFSLSFPSLFLLILFYSYYCSWNFISLLFFQLFNISIIYLRKINISIRILIRSKNPPRERQPTIKKPQYFHEESIIYGTGDFFSNIMNSQAKRGKKLEKSKMINNPHDYILEPEE